MNTSKQVNIMIGVVLLAILLFSGYMLNESNRQVEAKEEVQQRIAERGARLFVNNCRSCHGIDGEGHIGPALNSPAFVILEKSNEYGLEATPDGEAAAIRTFLHNTIDCGRKDSFMPVWGQRFGGSLSETQIDQIVTMIVEDRWDLVEEIGAEHDVEAGTTAKDVLADPTGSFAVTTNTCGQYDADTKETFRARDPFTPATPAPAGSATPAATGTAATGGSGSGGGIAVSLKEFSVTPASTSAAAGNVTFNVKNDGVIPHEFTIIKSDADPAALPVAASKVDESKVEVKGTTPEIASKGSQTVSAQLTAGKYVLVCQVPAHYGSGMHAEFTVQ